MDEQELFLAIDLNRVEVVQQILQRRRTNLNYIDHEHGDGTPLLAHALNAGHVRIARELIMAGADVNLGNDGSVRDKYRVKTPLNCALWCELPDVLRLTPEDQLVAQSLVRLLLEKGADPNWISSNATSPLQQLFYWWDGSNESVEHSRRLFRLLVTHGATENSLLDEEQRLKFRREFLLLIENALEEKDEISTLTNQEIEDQVLIAIEKQNIFRLALLLPLLRNGIHTRLEYGCTPLMHAIDQNLPTIAEFLIQLGAKIEQHERDYTPLFTAAENGSVKIVELLIKYGSNLTGEFIFNSEDSLSIAAFKFCCALIQFIKNDINFTSAFEFLKHHKKVAYQRLMGQKDAIIDYWNKLFRQPVSPWIAFGENANLTRHFTGSCLEIYQCLLHPLVCSKFQGRQSQAFDELQRYADIYHRLIKKIDVLSEVAPSQKLDEEASDEEDGPLSYQIVPFASLGEEALLTREEVEQQLALLNKELKHKTEDEIHWEHYPRFFIAQYRGLHYYRNLFSKNKRADHRQTFHLNRLAPAPAVYYMSSLTPDQHQLARESTLEANREVIVQTFDEFKASGETKQYWGTGKRQFDNKSDMLQQRMSTAYSGYKKDILQGKYPTPQLLYDRRIIGYPHYATSDLPFHALKYAYGQKSIEGLTEWRLRPIFQQDGIRLHPHPGKVFVSLYMPLQLHHYKARHVAGMRKRKKLHLGRTVLPERETSIPGGVDFDAPFYEELLEIPAFETYQDYYQERYGISFEQFETFKTNIAKSWTAESDEERTQLRKKVKNVLIEKTLIIYKERALLQMAQREARVRGGYLIYRHFDGTYGLEPEALPKPTSENNPLLYKRERELFSLIGEERFRKIDRSSIRETSSPSQSGIRRPGIPSDSPNNTFIIPQYQTKRPKKPLAFQNVDIEEQIAIVFINESNKSKYKETVLAWLKSDYEYTVLASLKSDYHKKEKPEKHFWHNRESIGDAFDSCNAMITLNKQGGFVSFMTWKFYANSIGAEIDIVEVKEEYRKQGIFKKMLMAFTENFTNIALLSAFVLEQSEEAFRRTGWEKQERKHFKVIKPSVPALKSLPDGQVIATCSEDFYRVQNNPEQYKDSMKYFQIQLDNNGRLLTPIVTAHYYEHYIGIYLDKKLVAQGKSKHLFNGEDILGGSREFLVLARMRPLEPKLFKDFLSVVQPDYGLQCFPTYTRPDLFGQLITQRAQLSSTPIATTTLPTLFFSQGLVNSQTSSPVIEQSIERIDTPGQHISLLQSAFKMAKKSILITTAGINRETFDMANMWILILDAKRRGVKVYIYCNDKNRLKDTHLIDFLDKNVHSFDSAFTHSKILVVDKEFVAVGSCNWLSITRDQYDPSNNASFLYQGNACHSLIDDLLAHINLYHDIESKHSKSYSIDKNSNLIYLSLLGQHRDFIKQNLLLAKKRVIICSPFIYPGNFEEDFNEEILVDVASRGVEIYFICLPEEIESSGLDAYLTKIDLPNIHLVPMNNIHLKTFIRDDAVIAEGSFNWLSTNRDEDGEHHYHEVTFVTEGKAAKELIECFERSEVGKVIYPRFNGYSFMR